MTDSKQGQAPVDRAESGQGGVGRWRGGVRRAILIGSRPEPWRRGLVLAALALLLGLLMLLHAKIPNWPGNLGSLVETFLPWFGLGIPVLLAGALWRRSASAVAALLLPVVVWVCLFGGQLIDKSHPGSDLTVASHNVGADNPDPAGTARDLVGSGADVLALEELIPQITGTYEKELANTYPYHTVLGTVGLWSKLPLSDTQPIDIMNYGPLSATIPADKKIAPNRALRTTVATDHGPRAADGVCGPSGVRSGESQGGLLDGLAEHSLAKALDNARILREFKNDDLQAFRPLKSAVRRHGADASAVERAIALGHLFDLAMALGEPTDPWLADLRGLELTTDDRQRIESELGYLTGLQERLGG